MKDTKFLMLVLAIGLLSACTDHFDELNTDPKNLTTSSLDQSTYSLVAANALYTPVHIGVAARGPFQLSHSLFADIYSNYQATTAPNFDSDRYFLVGNWLNGAYNWFYARAAPQIKYAEDFAAENNLPVENAIFKVWRVYAYHRMTDYWGPIPYSQFGSGERSVPFDSQESIYADFFSTLDAAISVLSANATSTSFLGSRDVVFSGDVGRWLRFANSLKLRLAMRTRYVDPAGAKTRAESAVASGVIESVADNAFVRTSNDWRNGYTTITQWGEFRMSSDMESILKGYLDPRVSKYFAPAVEPDPTDDPPGVAFPWEGMRNGQDKEAKQGIAFNRLASDMATPYTVAETPGPNWPLIRAAEVYFLRAEGALLGWNMGGGMAKDYYELGIQRSMEENGVGPDNLAGDDYVSSQNVPAAASAADPPVSTVPVAYMAGESTERQLEQIITQKWIALYPDSKEAWSERRRTGYPTLYPRLFTDNPDIPVTDVPRRVTWVALEYNNNSAAVQAAMSLLGGPDLGHTKLWWDKK